MFAAGNIVNFRLFIVALVPLDPKKLDVLVIKLNKVIYFILKFVFLGYLIYRVRVRRGGRKRPVTKGQTYGKPKTHGVNQLKFARNLQAVAEVDFNFYIY